MISQNTNIDSKQTDKKISVFYVLIALFVFAFILGIYINNIFIVNELTVKNNELKEAINNKIQDNDIQRSNVEKLSSFERIKVIATEKFELRFTESAINDSNYIVINKSEIQ
jgi:cell division protein FtsL